MPVMPGRYRFACSLFIGAAFLAAANALSSYHQPNARIRRQTSRRAAAASRDPFGDERLRSFSLYNTATRGKAPFWPQAAPKVSFYSCGPTVYDYAHIGNFRAFLTYDVLKRWLTFLGFDVDHVCNLTDIDDKIITRMQRDGVTLQALTEKYAQLFFEDLSALNVVPARAYPRATEHIDGIVSMVSTLLSMGAAYKVNDSVYFEVAKAARYGRLARLDAAGLEEGAAEGGGISDGELFTGEKKGARDFALWKAYKADTDCGVAWETPLCKGRPGWHI
jgi:cysteinyl-tRNA synthetase